MCPEVASLFEDLDVQRELESEQEVLDNRGADNEWWNATLSEPFPTICIAGGPSCSSCSAPYRSTIDHQVKRPDFLQTLHA